MDLLLDGKVALVTGSHRGTGAAIARVLADEGVAVLVHGLAEGEAAETLAGVRDRGGRAEAVWGDLRNDEGAQSVVRQIEALGWSIDLLINNYGTAAGGGWLDGDSADWTTMFETNVLSGVRMVRHCVPGMKQRGFGRVVFVGTVGSVRPRAQMPGYYASKASLANMTISLSKELSGSGITVNTVSPGLIATAEVRAMVEKRARRDDLEGDFDEVEARVVESFMKTPSARLARPEEVGALVAHLCSPLSASINGADLRIDGGAADCV